MRGSLVSGHFVGQGLDEALGPAWDRASSHAFWRRLARWYPRAARQLGPSSGLHALLDSDWRSVGRAARIRRAAHPAPGASGAPGGNRHRASRSRPSARRRPVGRAARPGVAAGRRAQRRTGFRLGAGDQRPPVQGDRRAPHLRAGLAGVRPRSGRGGRRAVPGVLRPPVGRRLPRADAWVRTGPHASAVALRAGGRRLGQGDARGLCVAARRNAGRSRAARRCPRLGRAWFARPQGRRLPTRRRPTRRTVRPGAHGRLPRALPSLCRGTRAHAGLAPDLPRELHGGSARQRPQSQESPDRPLGSPAGHLAPGSQRLPRGRFSR